MPKFCKWRGNVLVLIAVSALIAIFLIDSADAGVARQRLPDSEPEYKEAEHNIYKRHHEIQYGDGSLKKFFFMLKVILTIFGKH